MIGQRRFQVDDRHKLLERDGRLVAVEQTEPREMLTELTLDADLDQVTLVQDAVVLADESVTSHQWPIIQKQSPEN